MNLVLPPGTTFDSYEIESRLGHGGMGVVYLAWDPRLERRVALKILPEALAEDVSYRQRFIRESKLTASLCHPNVIPIFYAGESCGILYLAMQYVEGMDLGELLQREGPLKSKRLLSILQQVARALDAAHQKGLIHRDVKPANIMIQAHDDPGFEDQVYLLDFGLTKRSDSDTQLTRTGQFLGTLGYVAPEQIQGNPVDGRVDVYALGCLLYECLTGIPPYQKDHEAAVMYAHLLEAAPPVTAKRPDLSPAIDQVVARAMSKSREERFPSAGALIAAARRALPTEGPTQPNRRLASGGGEPVCGAGAAEEKSLLGLVPLRVRIAGREVIIRKEAVVGRSNESDIPCPDDRVSRHHLRLTPTLDGWSLRDLESANGTFVAGRRITVFALTGRTTLRLGDVYEGVTVDLEPVAEPKKRLVEASSRIAAKGAPVLTAGTPKAESSSRIAAIHVRFGNREFSFVGGDRVTMGRDESSTLESADNRVSRHHARLQRARDAWVLTDLGSKNGTYVHGERVTELEIREPVTVMLGDAYEGVEVDLRPARADARTAALTPGSSKTPRSGLRRKEPIRDRRAEDFGA